MGTRRPITRITAPAVCLCLAGHVGAGCTRAGFEDRTPIATGDSELTGDGSGDTSAGDTPADLCAGVTCVSAGQCRVAGTCNPTTGVCDDPPAQDGIPCVHDADVCTIDTCSGGECVSQPPDSVPGVLYVAQAAPGAGTGTSWCDAFTDLNTALAAATAGDSIWIAAGTYSPGPNRTDTFTLVGGVALYGGFAGDESDPSERVAGNDTVLSGDVNGDDVGVTGNEENNLTVLMGRNPGGAITLDRITIEGGNADTGANEAGGLSLANSTATLRDCVFARNSTAGFGGGVAIHSSGTLTLIDCVFEDNHADNGGGVYTAGASQTRMERCEFRGNTAQFGGGLYSSSAIALIAGGYFLGNEGRTAGGAIYSDGTLVAGNVRFLGNMAHIGAGIYAPSPAAMTLFNCAFNSNVAVSGGGALAVSATGFVATHCTFINNAATSGGTAIRTDLTGEVTINSSIVWSHTGVVVISLDSSTVTLNRTSYEGGWAGPGTANVDTDPGFADTLGPDLTAGTLDDDLRPSTTENIVDACDSGLLPADLLDLDADSDSSEILPVDLTGAPRQVDHSAVNDTGAGATPYCDLGPYELQN